MGIIRLLDEETVNRIAAGEVIERPASIVKELVENALDAGATDITVDIQNGGSTLIRVTDNGCGFERDDIPVAFLRHATSKIRKEEDLLRIKSLGFRGEALSSIASVSKVELLTKRAADFLGSRYVIQGGQEVLLEDIGCPDGTTFLVRDLFYNVPARRKFLKSAVTEAGYINELVNRFAVSACNVAFSLLSQGRTILHTSGNGNRKDAVYSVFGREIAGNMIPIESNGQFVSIHGYLGKSVIARGNRNLEMFFVNGRSVKSNLLYKAVEEGFSGYLMQHKYPFAILLFEVHPETVDVNIHPTKSDVRFSAQEDVYQEIVKAVSATLHDAVMIPSMEQETVQKPVFEKRPESFETNRMKEVLKEPTPVQLNLFREEQVPSEAGPSLKQFDSQSQQSVSDTSVRFGQNSQNEAEALLGPDAPQQSAASNEPKESGTSSADISSDFVALRSNVSFRIVGQVFKTYWILESGDRMYLIDQHAAHEKINYERMVAAMKSGEVFSQNLMPPILLSLTMREEEVLLSCRDLFSEIGFAFEHFGGRDYQLTAVPTTLYRMDARDYFLDVLNELSDGNKTVTPERVYETLASMSCKAAIKGNQWISETEAKHLFTELLSLENPFHCPHGRPTMISMTKQEMEKKFKRIL